MRTKTGWWVHEWGSSNVEVVGAEASMASMASMALMGTVGAKTVSVESRVVMSVTSVTPSVTPQEGIAAVRKFLPVWRGSKEEMSWTLRTCAVLWRVDEQSNASSIGY